MFGTEVYDTMYMSNEITGAYQQLVQIKRVTSAIRPRLDHPLHMAIMVT